MAAAVKWHPNKTCYVGPALALLWADVWAVGPQLSQRLATVFDWSVKATPINLSWGGIQTPHCPVVISPNTNWYICKFRWCITRQTQPFKQCWTNVEDVEPTLYKCYTNILCLLGYCTWAYLKWGKNCSSSWYYDEKKREFSLTYSGHLCLQCSENACRPKRVVYAKAAMDAWCIVQLIL